MNLQENGLLTLPAVALRGLVMFPDMTLHFDVGRKMSISAVKAAMSSGQELFLVTQMDLEEETPDLDGLYKIGVVCAVRQVVRIPQSDCYRVVVEGKYRARLVNLVSRKPRYTAQIMPLSERKLRSEELLTAEAAMRHVRDLFESYAALAGKLSPDVLLGVSSRKEAGELCDYIASNMTADYAVKQTVLNEINPTARLERLSVVLTKEIYLLEIEEDIRERVEEQVDQNQREYYLREQLKAVSAELNDGDSPMEDSQRYKEAVLKLGLPKEYEEKLVQECDRLSKMQVVSPESTVTRNYLDRVIALPWNRYTKDNLNIANARRTLERDHYGLQEVKERILELLAVRKLSPDIKGQIICLAGPPGVGKTSIARSLANAMNRNFARISLGGIRDEAEIRGHRKTYIGAMPGRIMDAIEKAKSANPLILLDEIDKLSSDYKGDPSSALLEVLDGEQNSDFRDHFLEIPFDLSKVLFITTANDIGEIPAPLRDRMEIIELTSYTREEKFHIAKKHLLPKQLKAHGISKTQVKIKDNAIRLLIDGYTREAGVRKLERVIASVLRKCAVQLAEDETKTFSIGADDLETLLGARKYKDAGVDKQNAVGVVNGLAWTSVGGELLQVEALAMEGSGKLILTGSLGDVMQESAKAALSLIRSRASILNITPDFYKTKDIHLHFPEGAVPKDGPSAGVTIATALASVLSDTPVNASVAMTGEITLTGKVLPIGGLREKSMAAYRAGMKTVLIPKDNAPDLEKVDAAVKEKVTFIPVSELSEVLEIALCDAKKKTPEKKAKVLPELPKGEKPSVWATEA